MGRPVGSTSRKDGLLKVLVDRYKFKLMSEALVACGGDIAKAARMLETSRQMFYESWPRASLGVVPMRVRVVKATGAYMPILHTIGTRTVELLHRNGTIEVIPLSQMEDWLRAGDVVLEPAKE